MQIDITQEWLNQHRELIRQTICPRGIPEPEFELFMLQCMRSGLDPLLKQAFCVARETKGEKLKKPDGSDLMEQWNDKSWHPVYAKVTRYEFQPSRDGMRVRASRFPDFLGVQASEVYAGDDIKISFKGDGALSSVEHSFNPAKRQGALMGAWARVSRKDKLPVIVWVDFAAYVQKSPLWASKPAVMACKVAEVTALRAAYPEAFGGLYVAGERPDDVAQESEEETVIEGSAYPFVRHGHPELPQTSATTQATPALEDLFGSAREPVPVPVAQAESAPAPAAPIAVDAGPDEDLQAQAIISEAQVVVARAIDLGRTPDALAQAQADLAALAGRARKLRNGGPARKLAGEAMTTLRAQLHGAST